MTMTCAILSYRNGIDGFLGAVVQAYIDQGEPVSSLWFATQGFGISSATLRNVMARSKTGLPQQPHTSAGRVPTDLGYRVYAEQPAGRAAHVAIRAPVVEARLRRAATRRGHAVTTCSQEVSRASHQVGFAIGPPADTTTLEHLDFVPLEGGQGWSWSWPPGGHVSHKVIQPTGEFDPPSSCRPPTI